MELQKNVSDWERALSMAAGVGLAVYALKGRRKNFPAFVAGVGLVGRGLSGYCPANAVLGRRRMRDDTREALGGDRGVRLEESVTITRPARELYTMWRALDQLPTILPHIERVDVKDATHSHWVMRGPAGLRFEWDAEIINDQAPDLIAWRSLPGADVASAGSVRFRERTRGGLTVTEVAVTLQYDAVGGKTADFLSQFTGQSPKASLREDLRQFKARIETSESPKVTGQPAGERSVVYGLAGGAV